MKESLFPALFTGIFGLVVLALAVAIAIYWLLFPWFVYHKLDKIIERLSALEKSGKDGVAGLATVAAKIVAPAAGEPPPIPGEERFFIHLNNETAGPFPIANIQDSFRRGKLKADTLVLKEGDKDWLPYNQVFPD